MGKRYFIWESKWNISSTYNSWVSYAFKVHLLFQHECSVKHGLEGGCLKPGWIVRDVLICLRIDGVKVDVDEEGQTKWCLGEGKWKEEWAEEHYDPGIDKSWEIRKQQTAPNLLLLWITLVKLARTGIGISTLLAHI